MKIDVGGVLIDNLTKTEAIEKIDTFVASDEPHFVVTPYSEMIVFAQKYPEYKHALNSADLSLADGIGILWAAKYIHSNQSLIGSLLSIILNRKTLNSIISEQISGSRLIYDLAKLASQKSYTVSLVGGSGNVAAQTAYELKKIYQDLKINLALSGRPFDEKTLNEISESNSDILLIAHSVPKQELWLYENYRKLNCKVAFGLGGTFDYVSGKRPSAPNFFHHNGLEWLWRLITQPWRARRMVNAIPVFIWKIYRYKHAKHKS